MSRFKRTWANVFKALGTSWQSLLIVHLAFTALGVMIFAPLLGLTGRLMLKLSGQAALADQDIAYFLLSPPGLIALVVFAGLLIGILAFEQASMMYIVLATDKGIQVSALDALRYAARQAHRLWLFTARLVIRILLLTLPFLALAAGVAWLLISDYDINFYLTEKPSEFWMAALLIGVILMIMLAILLRKTMQWSLTLPLLLFAGVSPSRVFENSTRITRGQSRAVLILLISWGILSLSLSFAILGLLRLLGGWIIPLGSGTLSLTVILLGALGALWATANFLITAFSSSSFASLLLTLYQTHNEHPVEDIFKPGQTPDSIRRFLPKTLISGLIIAALIATATGVWLFNGIPTNNEVIVVAHRGAAGKAPENTMAAMQQAIEDQTDWLEIDVQENADGEIVVIHDSDFMKLAGDPVKVWDATSEKLAQIDIGSWFDPAFSDQRPPSLKQVLELAKGKVKVVIELKYYGHDEQLEQRVIDIVEQLGMVDQTAIMSLKYTAIQKMRKLRPDWTLGLLSATAIGDLSRLDTDFLAVATSLASPGFIKRAHQAGRKVLVWTVDDQITMSRMISMGVDGLITNEPEMARQVLSERADMSTVERLLIHATQLFGEPYTPRQYRDISP